MTTDFKNIIQYTFSDLGYLLIALIFMTRLKLFKKMMSKEVLSYNDKIIFSIFFGFLGTIGLFAGYKVDGAIADVTNVAVIAGGILIGPFVGGLAGAIASTARLLIYPVSIPTVATSIITVISGLLAGYYSKRDNSKKMINGVFVGLAMHSLSIFFTLIFTPYFHEHMEPLRDVYMAMSIIHSIGIVSLLSLVYSLNSETDYLEGKQAKIVLNIANKTLPHFQSMEEKSLNEACQIICNGINAAYVSITDREKIIGSYTEDTGLLNFGKGNIKSLDAKEVLKSGKTLIKYNVKKNDSKNCYSHIIAPLKNKYTVIGLLKIYYFDPSYISRRNLNLALGLSKLIATQFELRRTQELEKMAIESEIRALQSQINPHFLRNTLNTAKSFIRTNPQLARETIVSLSDYLSYNMENYFLESKLKDELEHLRNYLKIEKARFRDRIRIDINVDEGLDDFLIPSLVLQPLVENSINHGILPKEDGGFVKIDIRKVLHSKEDKGQIRIKVEDNGIGIPHEIMNKLKNKEVEEGSIGLFNVYNRLLLLYDRAPIVDSDENGTKIIFYIEEN